MCRLFGLHAGRVPVAATFWLVDAPDSLAAQSHRNPDGAGIGVFDAHGRPTLDKQPLAAWQDASFATAARELTGTTFVAHVRYASTGGLTDENTHPFLQQGRMFAHNGVVQGLPELEARLATLGAEHLVRGETDSERVFALITAEIARADGDVTGGLTAAIGWIAEHLPVYSVNFVLSTPSSLWALRYPETNDLYVLDRPAAGSRLEAATARIHARSAALAEVGSVVLASEPMDDDPGWRALDPGELIEVDADRRITSTRPFAGLRHPLTHDDLDAHSAASQRPKIGQPSP